LIWIALGTWAWTTIAPICAALAIGTVACHVAGVSADTTDDVGGEVGLLGTVVLAVTDLTALIRVSIMV
jgi:hypothetical protein